MISENFGTIEDVRFEKIQSNLDSRGLFRKFFPVDFFKGEEFYLAISSNLQSGTIRGMHFQVEPYAEKKLITCLQGALFQVLIDLRPNSNTSGKLMVIELSGNEPMQVFIPKGVAHGYQTLEPNTVVHYCLSTSFSEEHSFAIDPNCEINIPWPVKITEISERDIGGLTLEEGLFLYADSMRLDG